MAPGDAAEHVYEFPLSGTMAGLLELEAVVRTLEDARRWEVAAFRHMAAARLAGYLGEIAPEGLETGLILETRRWTEYLRDLAARPGADTDKVERLRSGLDRFADRLPRDWPGYFQALEEDPWMAAYRASLRPDTEPDIRLGAEAWAASPDAADRFDRWLELLDPVRTGGETILRLLRDSLQREELRLGPEGHTLEWEHPPVSGLVEVRVPGAPFLPSFEPGPTGVRVGLHTADRLVPASEPTEVVLGWFTL
ncbi:MAG: cell division protein ZapD [Thiohalorhabdus sp.]|uniref:cell division protein ZapD n=1 Tax=Thiohalorhabdus sp. TaxID=3094134 RepID=UPI00397F5E25